MSGYWDREEGPHGGGSLPQDDPSACQVDPDVIEDNEGETACEDT